MLHCGCNHYNVYLYCIKCLTCAHCREYNSRMDNTAWNPAKLTELRKARGLTKAEIARELNTHWATIYRAENGSSASMKLIRRLAAYHRVPVSLLISDTIPAE